MKTEEQSTGGSLRDKQEVSTRLEDPSEYARWFQSEDKAPYWSKSLSKAWPGWLTAGICFIVGGSFPDCSWLITASFVPAMITAAWQVRYENWLLQEEYRAFKRAGLRMPPRKGNRVIPMKR